MYTFLYLVESESKADLSFLKRKVIEFEMLKKKINALQLES